MVEESDPHNFQFDFMATVFTVELTNCYDDIPHFLCEKKMQRSHRSESHVLRIYRTAQYCFP